MALTDFPTRNGPPNPVNVYGNSKLAGETAIAAADCRLFSERHGSLVKMAIILQRRSYV